MSRRDDTLLRSDDIVEPAAVPPPAARGQSLLASLRNAWRQLTSMRVALILLFLLALASLPGALLPQWNLNQATTAQFLIDHPTVGPILDKLGFFNVFSSPWYAAIYLALFTSLIGCLVPRTVDFARALRAKPVATPRNLGRLPLSATRSVAGDPGRGHRPGDEGSTGLATVVRDEPGATTISAEKGFLREVGNLVFHFSLLGLLAAVAVGKMFGFEGTVVVTEGSGFCSGSPAAYNTFRPGLLIDGTELAPFCVDLDAFSATYADSGPATDFTAAIRYQTAEDAAGGSWTATDLKVNDPLRLDGEPVVSAGSRFSTGVPDHLPGRGRPELLRGVPAQ